LKRPVAKGKYAKHLIKKLIKYLGALELFFILVGKKNDLEAYWIYIAHGKQWGINCERNK
jgi:hypothetical protein